MQAYAHSHVGCGTPFLRYTGEGQPLAGQKIFATDWEMRNPESGAWKRGERGGPFPRCPDCGMFPSPLGTTTLREVP